MNFDVSRLRRSDQIIGISAIAFFIILFFFKWYGVSSSGAPLGGFNVNVSDSGWQAFHDARLVWLLTILVALAVVAIASGALNFKSPVQPGVLVAGLGALSTLLILYRIVHHPTASASYGSFHVSVGIKIGIWFGLIAAAALTYGGYLGMQDEGTSIADVREQASSAISNLQSAASSGDSGSSAPTAAPVSDPTPPTPPVPASDPAPPIPLVPPAPSAPEPPADTPMGA
jgi:hypothetical protein